MLDSGADVNLIKEQFVKPSIQINKCNTVMLQGISPNSVTTLGTINIFILGKETEFHLIPDNAPFLQDGILLYDDSSIPFSETEYVTLKPRSVTPFYALITNPEIKTGYIPLNKSIDGIYFGEAIVTNSGGKAYLPIFNTSERAYNMEIPSISLQEFDTTDTLRQTTLTGATEVANGLCVNHNNVNIVSLFPEPLDPMSIDAFSHAAACSTEFNEVNSPDTQRSHWPMVFAVTSTFSILLLIQLLLLIAIAPI